MCEGGSTAPVLVVYRSADRSNCARSCRNRRAAIIGTIGNAVTLSRTMRSSITAGYTNEIFEHETGAGLKREKQLVQPVVERERQHVENDVLWSVLQVHID